MKLKKKRLTITAVVLALAALTSTAASALPIFSGSAPDDFTETDLVVTDPVGDVGVPTTGDNPYPEGTISGWDVAAIYFDYDSSTDTMYVGIDCDGICGDAEGNGDPGGSSNVLIARGGTDFANLDQTESFALIMDTNLDGVYEVVVGVRAEWSAGADIGTFGTYEFVGDPAAPQVGFGDPLTNTTSLYANPSASAPDIEFSIAGFSELPGFDFTSGQAFEFQVKLYAGSFQDGQIGEDYVSGVVTIEGQPGTGTPGYWKNHPEAWPVDVITIGGVAYSKDEAIPLMKEDKHDKTTTMFRSLVAAKLNVLIGNDSSCVADTILAADEWMATYGPVGSGVKANSTAWKEGEPLYETLDEYNNGELCAPSRDDLE